MLLGLAILALFEIERWKIMARVSKRARER